MVQPLARLPARVRDPLRRPLVGLCLCFLLGTGLGLFLPVPALLLYPVVLAGLALAAGPWWPHAARTASLWGSVVALACLSAGQHVFPSRADELSHQMQRPAETLEIRGIVAAEAAVEQRDAIRRVRFPLRVLEVRRTGEWVPATGRLRVRWQTTSLDAPPQYGEVWELSGVVRRPETARPSAASMAVPYRMAVEEQGAHRLASDAGSPFRAWCLARRQDCARLLSAGLEDFPESAGMLRALLLGYREDLPEAHEQVFARTGMMHIFAVSGLHVGVMAALVIALLQALGLPRYRWALLLAPLLVLYTVLTGLQPPAVRACVMALLYWSAPLLWRKPDGLTALALACVLILAVDPMQLTAAGFLLSFVVAAGLVILGSPVFRWIHGWTRPDPFDARPARGLRRAAGTVWKYVAGLLATSAVAWVSSTPLLASTFHLFSPVGLLGNLVVVPMAFVIVLTGCLALVTGALWGWMGEVFNHANRIFFDGVLLWIGWMDQVPWGHQWVPSPSRVAMVVWYSGWLLLRSVQHRGWRWALWTTQAVCLITLFGTFGGPRREAHLVAMDDDVALVWMERPGRCALVLGRSDAWGVRDLSDHLREQGVDRIDALVLTQGVSDPRLLDALQETFLVSELWTLRPPEVPGEGVLRPPIRLLRGGESGFLAGGSQWEVLYPSVPVPPSVAPGLVLRMGWGPTSILFAGVGGFEVQDAMCASDRSVGADLVVCARGADRDLLSRRWLRAVDPLAVWTTAGTLQWRRDDPAKSREIAEREGVAYRLFTSGENERIRLREGIGK